MTDLHSFLRSLPPPPLATMARRPSRTQSRHLLSSLSIAFFALIAIVCLCPVAVRAEDGASEYGTVIGIGKYFGSIASYKEANMALADLGTT